MAYGDKYNIPFKDQFNTYSYEIFIQEWNYASSTTELNPGRVPLIIEWDHNLTDKFGKVLQPSKCTITFLARYNWQYQELIYPDEKQYRIRVERDSSQFWVGIVKATSRGTEPQKSPPFIVTLEAYDYITDFANYLPDYDTVTTGTTPTGIYANLGVLLNNFFTQLFTIGGTPQSATVNWIENIDYYNDDWGPTGSVLDQAEFDARMITDDNQQVVSTFQDFAEDIHRHFLARIFYAEDTVYFLQPKITAAGTFFEKDGRFRANSTFLYDNFTNNVDYRKYLPIDFRYSGGVYSVFPGYRNIIDTAIYRQTYQTLEGVNFAEDDFTSEFVNAHWESISVCQLNSSWTDIGLKREYLNKPTQSAKTVVGHFDWDSSQGSSIHIRWDVTLTDGASSGYINISYGATNHSFSNPPASDEYVQIENTDGRVDGFHKVQSRIDATNIEILIPSWSDYSYGTSESITALASAKGSIASQSLGVEHMRGLEQDVYLWPYSAFEFKGGDYDYMEIEVTYRFPKLSEALYFDTQTAAADVRPNTICCLNLVIYAQSQSGSSVYPDKLFWIDGDWHNTSSDQLFIYTVTKKGNDIMGKFFTETINVPIDDTALPWDTGGGNGYVFYVAVLTPSSDNDTLNDVWETWGIQIDSLTVRFMPVETQTVTTTTAGGSNYAADLNISLPYADPPETLTWLSAGPSDRNTNRFFKYCSGFRDYGGLSVADNWGTRSGSQTDPLQQVIRTDLAGLHDNNSQIFSGTIIGDINPSMYFVDMLNFERVYMVQRLTMNYQQLMGSVEMIEVNPQGELSLVQDVTSGVATTLQEAYMLDTDFVYFVGNSDVVLKWDGTSVAADATGSSGVDYNAVFCFDLYNIWVGGSGGTLYFKNGTSWASQSPTTTNTIQDIFFITAEIGWLVTSTAEVEKTTSRGSSWSTQTSNLTGSINVIKFRTTSIGIFVGGTSTQTAIRYTSNGGTTWSTPSTFTAVTGRLFDLWNYNGTSTWIAIGSKGAAYNAGVIIYKSINDGADWDILYQDSAAVGAFAGCFHKNSPDFIYAVGNDFWSWLEGTLTERSDISGTLLLGFDREKRIRYNENSDFNGTENGWTNTGSWDITGVNAIKDVTGGGGTWTFEGSVDLKKGDKYTVTYSINSTIAAVDGVCTTSIKIAGTPIASVTQIHLGGTSDSGTTSEVKVTSDTTLSIQGISTMSVGGSQRGISTIHRIRINITRQSNHYGHYGFACGTNGKIKKIYLY